MIYISTKAVLNRIPLIKMLQFRIYITVLYQRIFVA